MNYSQALRYLGTFINYEKIPAYPYKESLTLKRIRGFLDKIQNPQAGLNCIHVAGTKGKGSTCAFLTYILREAGFKVGLYTSPHLSDFRERIRILNAQRPTPNAQRDFEGMISKSDLLDLANRLKPEIDKYNKTSAYGPLTFFEVYTAIAFKYFQEQQVDFCVLETGLGGRLDATNVVKPLASVITPISYEHTQKLGKTLKQIAGEKSGIIKPQAITISSPQRKEALRVIEQKCNEAGSRLYQVGKDIVYKKRGQGLDLKTTRNNYKGLQVNLIGEHQLVNASVAVGVIDALGLVKSKAVIKRGLINTKWPARCEVIGLKPLVVLDGAQNAASAKALKEAVRNNFKYNKLILVLGIFCDKDIKGVIAQLSGLADTVILTRANNLRAAQPSRLARYFKNKPTFMTKSVKQAREKAKTIAKKDDLILVTGSLYVAGEYKC